MIVVATKTDREGTSCNKISPSSLAQMIPEDSTQN